MASCRMIVKEFSWDERIWRQLTTRQALLFASALPHTESDGTLPGRPDHLRLLICPVSNYTTADVAEAVDAWKRTEPPIAVVTERDRIRLTDFEASNYNLDHLRQRRSRMSRKSQ